MKNLGGADREIGGQAVCRCVESRNFMPIVLGESAGYASQEAVNQHERVVLRCMTMVFIFAVIVGGCIASFTSVAKGGVL
jgi:hypothetical protein